MQEGHSKALTAHTIWQGLMVRGTALSAAAGFVLYGPCSIIKGF